MSLPTIGIIGCGFVGHATARCWMEHGEVKIYDVQPERATHSLAEASACDYVFVCLPTPQDCDPSIIEDYFGSAPLRKETTYIIKSTVPVGTTERLARQYNVPICHCPEFLTARCAVTDAQCPARVLVGLAGNYRWSIEKVVDLHRQRFPGVQVFLMQSGETELIKLAGNSFFALKVWYFNELYGACERHGFNWESVRHGLLSDGRIAHAHTLVPGPDGKRSFGGNCLPKDTLALSRELDGGDVLRSVLRRNTEMRGAE